MGIEWLGLGKQRTKLVQWIDQRGPPQTELQKLAKLNKGTVNRLCSEKEYAPHSRTVNKVLGALKKFDSTVKYEDF